MEMKLSRILYLIPLLLSLQVTAQETMQAPIPLELMFGNNRYGAQLIVNRNLPESERLSFFSVSYVEVGYNNDLSTLEFINSSQLAFDVYKGFGVTSGLNANRWGMSPTIGLRYIYASQKLVCVFIPDFIFTNDKNVAMFGLVEYRPKLTEKVRLYSRLQGLYNHNMALGVHERSFLQLRLGVSIGRYDMGLGSNFDYYGPSKVFVDNYGIFLKANM